MICFLGDSQNARVRVGGSSRKNGSGEMRNKKGNEEKLDLIEREEKEDREKKAAGERGRKR